MANEHITKTELQLIQQFIYSDPDKAARAFEELAPTDCAAAIAELKDKEAALCLEHMRPHSAAAVIQELQVRRSALLLGLLTPHHAAEIIQLLPGATRQNAVCLLDRNLLDSIKEIISYPKDSAGRLMKKEYVAFRSELQVQEVIAKLREMASRNDYNTYCYVVGPQNRLLGILNTRDLLLAEPTQRVDGIMRTKVDAVSPFTDREILTRLFREKKYLTIPVTDERGSLIGVISTEDIISSTEDAASEDLQILFGASAEEHSYSTVSFKIKKRLPWLYVNLATAFLAASVISLFENLIAKIAVLAVFLPVIAGQGGNAGIQTLAVVLRGLIMREISPGNAKRLIRDELLVGFANGAFIGLVTAVAAWIWKGNPLLGLLVGAAMLVNMLAAGISGAFLPLLLKRLGQDPAHSSGIFLTTITDVVGFAALLLLAYVFQSSLI
ncbi:MAG TPA: magnesium transporter [Elusimicrobiales bacterium]|nr:magnesium transporter [Elusimicrobiales bacterium]